MKPRSYLLLLCLSVVATLYWCRLTAISQWSFSDLSSMSLPRSRPTSNLPVSKGQSDPRILKALQSVDEKYCGGPCRFLLPVSITEQESKGQMHFRQLAFASGLVNRTLVLPNVGESRIGACMNHSFSFYYSSQWAVDNEQYFSHITMESFIAWIKERLAVGVPATSQTLHIHLDKNHPQLVEPPNCFEDFLNSTAHPERTLYLQDSSNPKRHKSIQKKILKFLAEEQYDIPEVQSVYYDRRYPFIQNPAADEPIPYNEEIMSLVHNMADQISPYWAIHWRTERVAPPENLVGCAESLEQLFHRRIRQFNLSPAPTLLLLTDYPHVFTQEAVYEAIQSPNQSAATFPYPPASTSFAASDLTPYHHLAFQYLYEHMDIKVTHLGELDMPKGIPPNWTVLPVSGAVAKLDLGILGIIDKMLAVEADVFIAGDPNWCARRSSFTRRIIDERIDRLRTELGEQKAIGEESWFEEPQHVRNIVEYFSLPQ
ncbi:hypothetical protein BX666DRAFT_2024080 [Dichotomocladium elegans]|nr:hypothetical protein BX666DRAFT_2024080 [Dichotomocladium elegans]